MYSEKPNKKRKNDISRQNTRWILFGSTVVVCVMALAFFAYQKLNQPKVDLSGVIIVEIHDPWWEYSFDVPPTATYMLEMVNGALVGQRAYTTSPLSSMMDITEVQIPADKVATFLSTLEQVELVKSDFYPHLADIEPYPSLQMIFQTDHDEIVFYTSPKAGNHLKWNVLINGQHYDIHSTIPMDALEGITEYLQWHTTTSTSD